MAKSLERSKFGRLLARTIRLHHHLDPRATDTIDLVADLEDVINDQADVMQKIVKEKQESESEYVLDLARGGDRRALAKYLEDDKKPVTLDIRKFLIRVLKGDKRLQARRPKASATKQRKVEIAMFVANRIFGGSHYMCAAKDAQKEFGCSDKTVFSACEEYAEDTSGIFRFVVHMLRIQPVANEVLRRGEPEHCERVRELLERWKAALDEVRPSLDQDDDPQFDKLTSSLFSGK
jgi:hypothetical protein